MKCSICGKQIPVQHSGWDKGNNAQPVNDGRCCDDCNASIVIPRRLRDTFYTIDEVYRALWKEKQRLGYGELNDSKD